MSEPLPSESPSDPTPTSSASPSSGAPDPTESPTTSASESPQPVESSETTLPEPSSCGHSVEESCVVRLDPGQAELLWIGIGLVLLLLAAVLAAQLRRP